MSQCLNLHCAALQNEIVVGDVADLKLIYKACFVLLNMKKVPCTWVVF